MNDIRKTLGLPSNGRVEVRKFEAHAEGRPQQRPQAKRKEGHDDLINRLRMRATVTITTINGDVYHGILQESDRFTITVRLPKSGQPVQTALDEPNLILLVYKHAVESFYLTKLDLNA